ncbi:MAG: alpha/beta hydrolase [Pseudomonadota bacterium]|nr:alpha/beta hydrolase [Pseudomonadota bacterium]
MKTSINKHNVSASRASRLPILLAVGAALATSALLIQRKVRRAELEHPPIGKFIEVDGVRLHYVDRGEGQPVVLLHGNGSMVEDLELSGLLDGAAAGYRVIAFDRPGYGYSERPRNRIWTPYAQAELIYQALQQLNIERPIIAGHSWGTMVSVALALQHPEYVRALALLSGYYFPNPRLDVPLLSLPAIPLLGDLMRFTISPLISRLLWPLMKRSLFAPSRVPASFEEFPVWMALRPSQLRASAAESALMIPSAMNMRQRYRELTMPIIILAGDGDKVIDPQRQSGRLHNELPLSELRFAAGAGHMVHHLVPDQVIWAINAAAKAAEHLKVPKQEGQLNMIVPAPPASGAAERI